MIVFHAHPDDEAIFTGIAIKRAVDRGIRVVLVAATAGDAGEPRFALPSGETLRQRRISELERACELLGVARLVVMDYQDSGAHRGPYAAGTLGATPAAEIADQLASIAEQENATELLHYDHQGIYPHIDHVQVHRAGHLAATRLGITQYQATVDRQAVLGGPYHVVRSASGDCQTIGVPSRQVTLTMQASPAELLAKMAAMSAHASQVGPRWLDPIDFAPTYGREWFVRRGVPGLLDAVAAPSWAAAPGAELVEQRQGLSQTVLVQAL